jgi:RNA polymerase sigma-70 factor (ECF subfamily)
MANIQTPDIATQSYVAGDENALATLIKRHESVFTIHLL